MIKRFRITVTFHWTNVSTAIHLNPWTKAIKIRHAKSYREWLSSLSHPWKFGLQTKNPMHVEQTVQSEFWVLSPRTFRFLSLLETGWKKTAAHNYVDHLRSFKESYQTILICHVVLARRFYAIIKCKMIHSYYLEIVISTGTRFCFNKNLMKARKYILKMLFLTWSEEINYSTVP